MSPALPGSEQRMTGEDIGSEVRRMRVADYIEAETSRSMARFGWRIVSRVESPYSGGAVVRLAIAARVSLSGTTQGMTQLRFDRPPGARGPDRSRMIAAAREVPVGRVSLLPPLGAQRDRHVPRVQATVLRGMPHAGMGVRLLR